MPFTSAFSTYKCKGHFPRLWHYVALKQARIYCAHKYICIYTFLNYFSVNFQFWVAFSSSIIDLCHFLDGESLTCFSYVVSCNIALWTSVGVKATTRCCSCCTCCVFTAGVLLTGAGWLPNSILPHDHHSIFVCLFFTVICQLVYTIKCSFFPSSLRIYWKQIGFSLLVYILFK